MKANVEINRLQQYLTTTISKTKISKWLKEAQTEAESSGLSAESKLISDLIEYVQQNDTPRYRSLRKNLKLRKLRII